MYLLTYRCVGPKHEKPIWGHEVTADPVGWLIARKPKRADSDKYFIVNTVIISDIDGERAVESDVLDL